MLLQIINLFFPYLCPGCDAVLTDNELIICTDCRHHLPLTNYHFKTQNRIHKLFENRFTLKDATALFYFQKNSRVQQLLHNLKYKNQQKIGFLLGNWLGHELKQCNHFNDIDVVVAVPIHKRRLKSRGYNQVTTFSIQLAEILEAQCIAHVLVKKVHSNTQVFQSKKKRWESVKDNFELKNSLAIYKKNVLLVDDLITTGSTIEACSKILCQGHPSSISVVAIAIADTAFH